MASKAIQKAVARLLEGHNQLPVDVKAIAAQLEIDIIEPEFPENPDLSGMLVRDGQRTFMAINQTQSEGRKRFTIAHEIGHFVLDEAKAVWIDKGVRPVVSYRRGTDVGTRYRYRLEEVRANRFAAELLMPEEAVRERFYQLTADGTDWEAEDALLDLAAAFDVSLPAMAIRLRELELLMAPGY